MIDKKLEQKLEQFLKENDRQYFHDSIEYLGLRERGTLDGKIKNFHIVSYMASVLDQPYNGNQLYFANFDEETYRLVGILGPQSYEDLEKD
ncbi:hypothetical protein [uncultured Chryseobacterium sp.]|uniref:hypothetical protein n=1 Tax=uncultured Chryseobacterium sp. TaxID=259322 RepID=UPI0025E21791|nr:hypothetical protein [uncultured Chryseobacterium sp.]